MTGPLGLFVVVAVVLFAGVADALPPRKVIGDTKAASDGFPMDSMKYVRKHFCGGVYLGPRHVVAAAHSFDNLITNADGLPQKKIVENTKAADGEFPYMVSLRYSSYQVCGGVIVGPRHIVTAANCLDGFPNDLQTAANLHVTTGLVFNNGVTKYLVNKIFRHPGFNSSLFDSLDDIAIIKLVDEISFNETQGSIGLPTELAPEGVLATVTEWGYPSRNEETKVAYSELMKYDVKILRADSCKSSFAGVADIRESHICSSGGSGVGTCVSPGGGALAYNGQLVGIVARRMDCTKGYPDVYTNVFHYVDWIKEMMKE